MPLPEIVAEKYDLGIIGGGPGGYAAAIRAAQSGLKVILFEKGKLGGTCLNNGCIPTKTLWESVKTWRELRNLGRLAISGIDWRRAEIDWFNLQKRKERTVGRLTSGVATLLKEDGVKIVAGKAVMQKRPDLIEVGEQAFEVKQVIIATGSQPRFLALPGFDSSKVLTSETALAWEKLPTSLLILGGGVIGVELASLFAALGVEVTIIEMEKRLLPNFDEEISEELARHLKGQGLTLELGARAIQLKEGQLFIEKAGEIKGLKGEKILVAVGRKPSYEGIAVEKLGLKIEKGALCTDEFLKTNVPGVYALGDVNGQYMLAHKAFREAQVVVANILGKKQSMTYDLIPQCVYTFPEIAFVGLTEVEAREKFKIKTCKFPWAANSKAQIAGTTRGFIKVIIDEVSRRVLGVHLFGVGSAELIAEVMVALQWGATAEVLAECIHPHPTLSEAVGEAYQSVGLGALHFRTKE